MRLLLTNDDGIGADGIRVLADILSEKHEVWVIAPDTNRSAVSHGLTMRGRLKVCKVDERMYSCSGLPADCTTIGVKALLPAPPDAVISGINNGANLGTDVLYSGTAAAARQGSLFDIPSLAVSLAPEPPGPPEGSGAADALPLREKMRPLARFIADHLEELTGMWEKDTYLNINARALGSAGKAVTESPVDSADGTYSGIKRAIPAKRVYHDDINLYTDSDGQMYSQFLPADVISEPAEDSDAEVIDAGYVAVSIMRSQPSVLSYGE